MNIHKRTKLLPYEREQIWQLHSSGKNSVAFLADFYQVSRPTVYKVLKRARLKEFIPRDSSNQKYRCLQYGIKRLAKVESKIEAKKKAEAKRYNKSYPGEMLHFDTKRLPLLKGEKKAENRQYLFVAIDDFSRELFAAILPNKTMKSAATFMKQVIEECPYTIEVAYSDNGTEYKGNGDHDFVAICQNNQINQKFTRVARPQTNGKAERVIRTLMEQWHHVKFKDRSDRNRQLCRYINYYNSVKPHKGINDITPYEKLTEFFFAKPNL